MPYQFRSIHEIAAWARLTPAFTCKARLNDRPRSGRTFAPCLVQGFVVRRPGPGAHTYSSLTFCASGTRVILR